MERGERVSRESVDPGPMDLCRQVISTLDIPVLIMDSQLLCIHSNVSFNETFRLRRQDISGVPLSKVDNGLFDINELRLLLAELLAGADAFGGVDFVLDLGAPGARIFSMSGSSVEKVPSGKLVLLAMRDVTDERTAQRSQRDSEAKYRVLYESSRDAIMVLAPPHWRFIAGNPATLRLFRCTTETEFATLGPWDLSPPLQPDGQRSSVKAVQDILKAMENGSNLFEWTHRRLDGETFQATVLLTRIRLEGRTLLQSTVRENNTREGAELLRSLIENIPTVTYRCTADENWTMEYISLEIEKITGYPPSDYIGNRIRSFSSVIHADDRQAVTDGVWKGLRSHLPFTLSYRLVRADGGIRWVFEKGQGIFGPNGELQFLDGIIFDNTEQKLKDQEQESQRSHLEELVRSRTSELRESEEKYRSVVEKVSDGIFIHDDDGFLFVNEGMCAMTGFSRSELYSMMLLDIVHPGDRSLIGEQRIVRELDREAPEVVTVRFVKKDGQPIYAESSMRTFTYHDRRALLGVCRDISDIKKQDEERNRIQRLESMSAVVEGIAHDFNNFLTVILGNISLARMMVEPDTSIHEMLSDSEMVAASASKLTEQLLAFSRRVQPVKSELRIAGFLEEAMNVDLFGTDITTEVLISDDIWNISADHAQIAQVIRNIVVNAVQAMPGGGTVVLRGSNFVAGLDGREPLDPGLYVRIEVDDTGPGIPEEILPRIFDPFFTTKEFSVGLGLATAHSIVTGHGGRIRADNLPGGGCRCTVFLPTDSAATDGSVRRLADLAVSGGRILVMDDKAMVRSTVAVMLEHLGYEVETAGDGREAINLYKRSMEDGKRFDAVILDLTVQDGMGGKETIVELRRLDPHVRAVLSSGYSSDPFVTGYRQHGFSGVVVKPYSLAKLASTIRGITRN